MSCGGSDGKQHDGISGPLLEPHRAVEKSPSPPPVKMNMTVIGEALLDWSDTPVVLALESGAGEKLDQTNQEHRFHQHRTLRCREVLEEYLFNVCLCWQMSNPV